MGRGPDWTVSWNPRRYGPISASKKDRNPRACLHIPSHWFFCQSVLTLVHTPHWLVCLWSSTSQSPVDHPASAHDKGLIYLHNFPPGNILLHLLTIGHWEISMQSSNPMYCSEYMTFSHLNFICFAWMVSCFRLNDHCSWQSHSAFRRKNMVFPAFCRFFFQLSMTPKWHFLVYGHIICIFSGFPGLFSAFLAFCQKYTWSSRKFTNSLSWCNKFSIVIQIFSVLFYSMR